MAQREARVTQRQARATLKGGGKGWTVEQTVELTLDRIENGQVFLWTPDASEEAKRTGEVGAIGEWDEADCAGKDGWPSDEQIRAAISESTECLVCGEPPRTGCGHPWFEFTELLLAVR